MHERHAVTWLAWAVATALSVQLAPNPLYVVVVIVVAAVVVELHRRPGPLAGAFGVLVGVGLFFAGVRTVLTALTTHAGGDRLFTLPEATLPRLLGGFTVGGPIETDVVLRSASEGLAIVGVLAAFGAFNAVVSHYELVQSAPRAFYELGLVVTVSLAFVPSTLAAVAGVREADKARTGGRVVRRGRIVRQVVPVLETGLERAVHLAESMDARGFARLGAGPGEATGGVLGLASLLALGAAFVALVGRQRGLAVAFGAAGVVALVAAVVITSRAARRTRYRQRRLSGRDVAIGVTCFAAPLALAALSLAGDDSLRWIPGSATGPALSIAAVVALLPLLAVAPRP